MIVSLGGNQAYAHTGGRPFDPNLPPVVLIHGAGMDHSVWRFQARSLAHHGHAVLAVDLPGHGRSQSEPCRSVEGYAGWLAEFLDALGSVAVAVVGNSMGSLIGIELAAAHASRVTRLVLISTSPAMSVHPDLLSAADRDDHIAFELITGWSYGLEGHLGGHAQPGIFASAGTTRLLERSRPGVLAADLRACAAYAAGARAALIRCPTLVVAGSADRMTPARAARQVATIIPGARLVVIEGAGHQLMSERPDDFRQLMEGFLAEMEQT